MTVRILWLALALGAALLMGSSLGPISSLHDQTSGSRTTEVLPRSETVDVDAVHERIFREIVAQDPEWAS